MNTQLILIIFCLGFSQILQSTDRVQEVPLPFDRTFQPFIHIGLLVVYGDQRSVRVWDPARKEELFQWSRRNGNTEWDIVFDKNTQQMRLRKPNGRTRFIDLKREESDESVNLESSIVLKDRLFAFYWDGVVKAWDISSIKVKEIWSTQLKKAKYGFAELSLSLDAKQLILLRKQGERTDSQFGIFAVLDIFNGKIIHESQNEMGNIDAVFSSKIPLDLLLNSPHENKELVFLHLPTGGIKPITLAPKPRPFYGSFHGDLDTIVLLSKNESTLQIYRNRNALVESSDVEYSHMVTFTSSLSDQIMYANATPNQRKIYVLLGDGSEIETLQFINTQGKEEFRLSKHIPKNFPPRNREARMLQMKADKVMPQFSEDESLVFFGNSIGDRNEKKVIYTFDNFVEEGQFFTKNAQQFFLSKEWLFLPELTVVFKLYNISPGRSPLYLDGWLSSLLP